ncbi:MAG: flap endonuclease-1 [Candidatus Micrarchaeota archaeon]|nr:flap endonuclease-1 [Candidatus Micrarchaeota archaeon]
MGVQLGKIVSGRTIERGELSGRKIAIDAYNWLYQFLTIIRDRETGEPLKAPDGRITSHISGILYRTARLIETGIKPVWVFDGEPPEFKSVVEERKKIREEARERYEEALKAGKTDELFLAAQQATVLTEDMVNDAKRLIELMGLPVVQAPSEGEAECAFLCSTGKVFATASQDFDSLLFGSPRIVRNLSISERRKVSGMYVKVEPELIELERVLSDLKLTREQLVVVCMLMGTDYNPGIKGIGPKRAVELVRKFKDPTEVFSAVDWDSQFEGKTVEPEKILNFFLHPPVSDAEIKFRKPDENGLLEMLVGEMGFSEERVRKVLEILSKPVQTSLSVFG